VVAGDPIHAGAGQACATEDVAATDHDAQLHAHAGEFGQSRRQYARALRGSMP
jgi:hypothetical protein